MGWHQIIGLLSFLFFLQSSLPFTSSLCLPDQRDALLLFKNSFVLDSMASHFTCNRDLYYLVTSYPKTKAWNKGLDCCSWDGVTCDVVTGNVVGLDLTCSWLRGAIHSNSSILLLRHLRSLNLSGNDFVGSQIVPNLSAFAEMTHLNLSRSRFSGTIPSEISRLSKLVSLDLSYSNGESNPFSSLVLENSVFTALVQNLTAIRKLVLDEVDMSMVSPISLANLSTSLTHLRVSACSLQGVLPDIVFRLPSLTSLYACSNLKMSGILPKFNWTGPLVYLSLDGTSFYGEIPDSIGNMKKLTILGLSDCKFIGYIPSSLQNLKQLQVLHLAGNNFSGVVNFEIFSSLKNLQVLNVSLELNLTYNTPEYAFPKLEMLALPSCNLTKFPHFLSSLKQLTHLNLSFNRISGEIPKWFWEISPDTLELLDLSHNLLEGRIQQLHWKRLRYIKLRNNSFQGPLPIPPPSASYFHVSINNFTGEIPSSICQLSSLSFLCLSNNNLFGNVPPCLGNITNLGFLDLSNNKFAGSIPLPSPFVSFYSIASNNFTGKIPSLICNATKLEVLELSYNSLTSSLPRCLTNFSTSLSILDLRMNHLEGTIPQTFSWRNSLTTLDLSRNQFEGTLPQSLVKCKYLKVVDINNNQIEDTFPRWLGTLLELQVLVLRFNKFKGLLNIPKGAHLFPKLHILDLSNNNFSGPLPVNLIINLKAMIDGKGGQDNSFYMKGIYGRMFYYTCVSVMLKGLEIELMKIGTSFTAIDLSHNSFQGDIPGEFGHLHSLMGLNLSHNQLTGFIPPTLGNLTNLEWLDLSSNKLNGEIPKVLGDLTFLGYFNLSKNQFTGRIPQDKQLSTFSSDSFSGNPGLCGTPLPKACPSDAQPPPPLSSSTFNRKEHESWFKQKAIWIGYASGIVIGISITYIAFETGRPKWLTQGVRKLERKVAERMEKPKWKTIKFHGQ